MSVIHPRLSIFYQTPMTMAAKIPPLMSTVSPMYAATTVCLCVYRGDMTLTKRVCVILDKGSPLFQCLVEIRHREEIRQSLTRLRCYHEGNKSAKVSEDEGLTGGVVDLLKP